MSGSVETIVPGQTERLRSSEPMETNMGMPMEQAARTLRYTMEAGEAVRAGRLVNRQLFRLMAVVPVILFAVGLVVLLTLGWPDGAVIVVAIWAMAILLAGLDLAMPAISARQAARRYPDLFVGETVVSR